MGQRIQGKLGLRFRYKYWALESDMLIEAQWYACIISDNLGSELQMLL